MARIIFIGIVLLHYLLVVVETNVVSVNAHKYTSTHPAARPYVHADDCQKRFYLQFDCLDKCQDVEAVEKKTSNPSAQHVYFQTCGVDVHCMTSLSATSNGPFFPDSAYTPNQGLFIPTGFNSVKSPPPRIS